MVRTAKARWSERLYTRGRRFLRCAHLDRAFDFYWCELLLSAQPGPLPSPWDTDGLWLGEVRALQFPWLAAFAPDRAREFPGRWAAGYRCFAAALASPTGPEPGSEPGSEFVPRCVGYLWVATGPARLPGAAGYGWDLPHRTAWIFDALFHPLVLGTYPDLVRYTTAHLRHQGFSAMLGQVEYDNRVSRRVHRMLGGKRLGWVASLRCAGVTAHLEVHPQSHRRSWTLRLGRTPVPLAAFLPPAIISAVSTKAAA